MKIQTFSSANKHTTKSSIVSAHYDAPAVKVPVPEVSQAPQQRPIPGINADLIVAQNTSSCALRTTHQFPDTFESHVQTLLNTAFPSTDGRNRSDPADRSFFSAISAAMTQLREIHPQLPLTSRQEAERHIRDAQRQCPVIIIPPNGGIMPNPSGSP